MTINNALNAPNVVIQKVSTNTSAFQNCSTILPEDDTIPVNTEGDEVLTLAITPTSATNILEIRFDAFCYVPTLNAAAVAALFQDSTANALAAQDITISQYSGGSGSLIYRMVAGTTSSTTFKIRVGPSITGSAYINGTSSRLFGGVAPTYLTITEYQA